VALLTDILGTEPEDYLQALIEFATQPSIPVTGPQEAARIRIGGNDATPGILQQTFGQPFADLSSLAYYGKANEQVHKIRLVIEVLRNLLRLYPPSSPQALASAEQAYLQVAYTTLLTQIGTSYEEIRLARTYKTAARQALADRLGITVDRLPALLLDPNAAPASPMALSETVLEQLFGLEDSMRDPLSDGPATYDTSAQVARWTLDGVEWNRNTDADGLCYLTFSRPADGSFQANLYRDPARNSLVATSGRIAAGWTSPLRVSLSPQNNSGLAASSNIVINYQADTQQPIILSAIPRLLSWQMLRSQSRWSAEDFLAVVLQTSPNVAQAGQQNVAVSITGQYTHFAQGTTTADFGTGVKLTSLTVSSATAATAVVNIDAGAAAGVRDVTLTSNNETARLSNGFRVLVIAAGQPALMQETPNTGQPGQQKLSVALTGQATHFIQGTTKADFGPGVNVASLTVTSATAAAAVLNIDPGAAPGGRNVTLTTDTEVVTLAGGLIVVAAGAMKAPLIDPDLLFDQDFKHPLMNDPAYALHRARQQLLLAWYNNLKPQPGTTPTPQKHLDTILQHVLGKTSADLTALDDQRSKGNDISWQLASINLLAAAFNYLLNITALIAALQPGQDLLTSEWDDVYNILVQVVKTGAVQSWRNEEQGAGLTLGPDWFQIRRDTDTVPPQLSTWRATSSARVAWLNTLRGRINQRQDLMQGLQAAVDATEVSTLPILRDGANGGGLMGALTISIPVPGLHATGMDTTAPAQQGAADRYWTIIRNPSDTNSKPAIVTRPNPAWLANSGASQWIAPQSDENSSTDPPGNYTYRTMIDLSGFDAGSAEIGLRIAVDNQVTDIQANSKSLDVPTVSGFTAFTPITLNNGLTSDLNLLDFVVQNNPPTSSPSGLRVEFPSSSIRVSPQGNKFTEWFLIDMDCGSYQVTTRLNQATETLQALFFSLRTGKFQDLPPLKTWQLTDIADYDAEWVWMGSYGTWVAAMGVFLYPENLLLPLLRPPIPSPVPQQLPFDILVTDLTNLSQISPKDARDEVLKYWQNVRNALAGKPLPAGGLPGPLNDQLSDNQLRDLSGREKACFDAIGGDAQGAYYLREAFFFVPIYVASQLQQAGQFAAALDWYRTIYAYYLPEGQRKIYHGLVSEETIPTQYAQTPQWLRTSLNPHDIAALRADAYTRFTLISLIRLMLDFADTEYARDTVESLPRARTLYLTVLDLLDLPELLQPPPVSGIPLNPVLTLLRQHAEIHLFKLRTARDIAGLVRSSAASPPIAGGGGQQPTEYRYSTLIERAKQLVALAQQMESSFLATLEKYDGEKYAALRAQQDLDSAGANVTLQNLKAQEAGDNVTLASDQKQRASDQVTHWQNLINSDIVSLETASIGLQYTEAGLQAGASALYVAAGIQSGFSLAGLATSGANATQSAAQVLTTLAAAAGAGASGLAATASLEEKQIDWQDQLTLAQDDQVIANQQYTIAQDQQKVATQEQVIASQQHDHTQAVVDFLTTQKFTGAALYDWMSGILQRVYSYFLQQASAVARMAQNQLAFERQVVNLNFIQADYWLAPSTTAAGATSNQTNDKKGLTGSARLLQDITRLDVYAFETDQRKLQLTKMMSLAQVDPFAFQQFRQTGVLRFATPMSLFDRDFPGHLLRLIKRVRVAIIALIPPTQGIRATLANPGVSRTVVGVGSVGFQTVSVTRQPQVVALTSPANSAGLFIDLADTQAGLFLPFENLGVDTVWEFTMPQAANPLDYTTIADVLLTLDYTALDSADYRAQVVRQLDSTVSADRAYSFRQEFADAWYELNNPNQSSTPMIVQLTTTTDDFPPNLSDLQIQQLLLYFVPKDGASFQISVKNFQFTPTTSQIAIDVGAAGPTSATISTRRGNAANWVQLIGQSPFGQWQLALPDDNPKDPNAPRNLIASSQITDILFVISYSGTTAAWPN
jgi:hypothetical protein